MLTNLTKPRYSYARRLMVLPLLATVVLLFAFKLKANAHNMKQNATVANVAAEGNDTLKNDNNSPSLQDSLASFADTTKPSPLFILNGYPVDKTVIDALDRTDIESINVIKGKTATTFYGEKGANGVVMVVLKKSWHPNASDSNRETNDPITANGAKQLIDSIKFDKNNISGIKPTPLYIVDGKNISEEDVKKIAPDDIENLTVIKGKFATHEYGDNAINGVIEITTKNALLPKTKDGFQNKSGKTKELPANMLYLVDGKTVSREDVKLIDAHGIESVDILSSKTATEKYGEKGNNGAMEITMKKPSSANFIFNSKETHKIIHANSDTTQRNKGTIGLAVFADRHPVSVNNFSLSDSIAPATFPGGDDEWVKYIDRYLRANVPSDNGAPAGNYTVMVLFTIDANGNLSNVKALNDPGYGTAAEAVRVIEGGPEWIPGKRNGKAVAFTQKQGVTFQVALK